MEHIARNYALECLYLLFQVLALLTHRDAHRIVWNRSVNNHGTAGGNIALDLEVEMSNLYLKQAIKNLGVNATESAVSQICKSEQPCRKLLSSMDKEIKCKTRSTYHSHKSPKDDIKDVVTKLLEEDAFTIKEKRDYKYLQDFNRDLCSTIDMSNLFKWINMHKMSLSELNLDELIKAVQQVHINVVHCVGTRHC